MAASNLEKFTSEKENLAPLTCPICFELYKKPRKLSVCLHIFCENCLCQYLTELKTKADLGREFNCPLCRQANPGPNQEQELFEWVQTLDFDTDLDVQLKSWMKEEKVDYCESCKESEKITIAVCFCLDCQEHYCGSCSELVHRHKVLRDHYILKLESGNGEINEIMANCLVCPKHAEKTLRLYCEEDESLLCIACATENKHRVCTLADLTWVSSKEDTEKKAAVFMDKFDKLEHVSNTIIQEERESERENKRKSDDICLKIQEMRGKVNVLFDNLEETVKQQCTALTKKFAVDSFSVIEKLQKINTDIHASRCMTENVLQQETPSFQVVVLQNLAKRLNKQETEIIELSHECRRRRGFELQVEKMLDNILHLGINEIHTLAIVREKERKISLPNYTERYLLKYLTITKSGDYDIRAPLVISPLYTAFSLLDNNNILFVDYSNGLCVLANAQYEFVDALSLGSCVVEVDQESRKPWSVTDLKNGVVAITIPDLMKIVFVCSDEKLKILGEIKTAYKPKAIHALRNGDLALSWHGPAAFGIISVCHFCKFEEKIFFDRDTTGRVLKSFKFMAVDEKYGHIMQSCHVDKAVYCFDFHGNPVFKYTHENLSKLGGVAVDRDGNVYICEKQTSCLHILSPDGILIRLFKDGCPHWPLTLGFRTDSLQFIVSSGSSKYRKVFVFEFQPTKETEAKYDCIE